MSTALDLAKSLLSDCQHENECHANRILREAAQELVRMAAIEKLARSAVRWEGCRFSAPASITRLAKALNMDTRRRSD